MEKKRRLKNRVPGTSGMTSRDIIHVIRYHREERTENTFEEVIVQK